MQDAVFIPILRRDLMKCPYNRKSEKHVQKWKQEENDEGIVTSGGIADE